MSNHKSRREDDDQAKRPRFVRVRTLVEQTGLSKSSIHSALRSGRLRAVKLNGAVLIDADSVEAWLTTARPYATSDERASR